ncbi:MAG TPA: D-2-hydroxyacid dehydrogenase [Chitinophagaceae bacterium]|nr:D-2-hydroxyacid dehydrogenase [Chitinophagaceae bacterium]
MKIVILDGYAMNPGDLSWNQLKTLGDIQLYDRTPIPKVADRIKDAEIVLTNKAVVHADAIQEAVNLKYVGVMATGINVVDVEAAKEKGITVTNIPAYSTDSVAQLTFSLILEFANHVQAHAESVAQGNWVKSEDFSYLVAPQIELKGKTLALIGFGKIGQAVARIGLAFGMKVISSHHHPKRDATEGVTFVEEKRCFREADFLSLHCPLNEDNKGFVNKERLNLMKSSGFIINTARGPLINEADLAETLNEEKISGAALDVLSTEPPSEDNPLLKAKNCKITPHIAWSTLEARTRLMSTVVDNIKHWQEGTAINVVG